jgi:hypothetical protein
MRGLAILGVGLLCAGCGQVADAQAKLIDSVRIHDAVSAYEQATGPVDRCVKAKSVAIAYSDARDPAETAAWSAREHEDCQAALIGLHVGAPTNR